MIEINLEKLEERGTHIETRTVRRGAKTFSQKFHVGKKVSGRKDTGKIATLPDDIKQEILEVRRLGYSGQKIKDHVETMIGVLEEKALDSLKEKGVITDHKELTVTAQSLVNWAKARGVESTTKRQTGLKKEKKAHEKTTGHLKRLEINLSEIRQENEELKQKVKEMEGRKKETDKVKSRLREEISILENKLSIKTKGTISTDKKKGKKMIDIKSLKGKQLKYLESKYEDKSAEIKEQEEMIQRKEKRLKVRLPEIHRIKLKNLKAELENLSQEIADQKKVT